MNARLMIMLALALIRTAAAATKNTTDDKVVEVADRFLAVAQQTEGFNAWTAVNLLLEAARFYSEESARTADEKLVSEFQAVADALRGVVGREVFRSQLQDVVVTWPFLDAPGVARA